MSSLRSGMLLRAAILACCAAGFDVLSLAHAESPAAPQTPAEWMQQFRRQWDEQAWTAGFLRRRDYMRPLDDAGWKARMLALQGLVRGGKASIPVLVETLKTGSTPERILAAQALGYLAPHAPTQPLLEAARSDRDPAVRLYAVDALGMKGAEVDFEALRRNERNNDVKKHIGYAIERKGKPVDEEVIQQLLQWDPRRIDTARLGQPAPDFTLQTVTGRTIRLSDYKNRRAVVLVFIYGDT